MRARLLAVVTVLATAFASAPAAAAPTLTKAPRVERFVEAVRPEGATGAAVVVMSVTISAKGVVEGAVVTESAGTALDDAAVAAMKAFVFEPAEIDGKPAPIKILYRYEFTEKIVLPTSAVFEGTVRDLATKEPLAHVEIAVEGGGKATTDASGRFRVEEVPPGKHTVSLSGDALTTLRTEETFDAGKKTTADYDVALPEPAAANEPKDDLEIVVVAPALEKKVASTAIGADEGRRLPGTQGDVLKVVESMPGVARAQAGSGQLVVWGSAPADTRVYVDGVRVPQLYHGGGVRSVLSTELVDSVELAPGGYGAMWGRGLGGLVTVKTRWEDTPRLRASASLDLLDAGAAVRAPLTKDVHVDVAARRSHLDTTIAPFAKDSTEDLFPVPHYEDAQVRASFRLGAGERLDVTGLHSSDRITRAAPSADPTADRRETHRVSFERVYARYERTTTGERSGVVTVVPWFGVDHDALANRFGGVPTDLTTDTTLGGLRTSWRGALSKAFTVSAGLDAEVAAAKVHRAGSVTNPAREGDARVFGQVPADRLNADDWQVTTIGLAPWGELDFAPFGEALHVVPGVRFDPSVSTVSRKTPAEGDTPSVGAFQRDTALEPRLAVHWRPAPRLGVRAAFGTYHQPAAPEDQSSVFGDPLLPNASARHWVGGTALRIADHVSLDTTAFYTTQDGLAVRSTLASPLLAEALVPNGAGRAYGLSTVLRHELSRGLTGWISYTISRSQRRDAPGLDYRLSDYDQTHVLTAVASYALGRGFEVGARARVSTGFPRTPVAGVLYDTRRDVYEPVLGPTNTDRIPAFFELDLRVAKKWTTAAGELEAYLEVENATDRKNPEEIVYSRDYKQKEYITGIPILPIAGVRWSR